MKSKQKRLKSKEENKQMPLQIKKERLASLNNKDDHKGIYKEMFDKLVKKKFDEIKDLKLHDFNNGIQLF